MNSILFKIIKLLRILRRRIYRSALFNGVAAAVEHERVLIGIDCRTVIDIGANRGQFALVSRCLWPRARLYAFEPLSLPASVFRQLYQHDSHTTLYASAIGSEEHQASMHVSRRDDSSSLLPITEKQSAVFPGTEEIQRVDVNVAPLSKFVSADDIDAPALLKVDVQGFELEVLKGCASLLTHFQHVYVECSFVELYATQSLADEVIRYLSDRSFRLRGVYNVSYDRNGKAIQADFMFEKP